MKGAFWIVVAVVILFVGFMLGYSIPPFIHSGAFSERKVKGVSIEIGAEEEKYYQDLYGEEGE